MNAYMHYRLLEWAIGTALLLVVAVPYIFIKWRKEKRK